MSDRAALFVSLAVFFITLFVGAVMVGAVSKSDLVSFETRHVSPHQFFANVGTMQFCMRKNIAIGYPSIKEHSFSVIIKLLDDISGHFHQPQGGLCFRAKESRYVLTSFLRFTETLVPSLIQVIKWKIFIQGERQGEPSSLYMERHVSGWRSASIFRPKLVVVRCKYALHEIRTKVARTWNEYNEGPLDTRQSFSCYRISSPCLFGQVFGPVSLVLSLRSQLVHLVNLSLHFIESLLQRDVAFIQGFSGQSVRPAYLKPLEAGKYGISNEKQQASDFCPKFYFVTPVLLSFAGYLVAVWGWWTLYWQNPSGWGELRCGLAVLGGCAISIIFGVIFVCRIS
jgi:hypothetical protein